MILVDTSVWVDHFRRGDARLADLLHAEQVACHPFVIGELACGNLRNRDELLALLAALLALPKAADQEVLNYIDQHGLAGTGLGLVDVHLLASCQLAGGQLWTRDRRLSRAAARLGLAAA